jgi:endoglucanase
VADFSDFTEPGSYYVQVVGGPRSPVFRIASDVYDAPLEASILGLYGQRCGVEVHFSWNGSRFGHGACHLRDGDMTYSEIEHEDNEIKDGVGGWHDAGDYGKYTVNAAFAAAQMLKAWEHFSDKLDDRRFPIPEKGGDLPDLLDEVRFQMEWLLKMQFPDGQASHKLTAINFPPDNLMPSFHDATRYFTPMSTAATADLVAVLAQAARVYEQYDAKFAETMLDAATLGMQYLSQHSEHVNAPPTGMGATFQTGGYGDGSSQDERLWAKVEYWETTGDSDVLEAIEESIGSVYPRPNWDWQDMANLALYTYVLSEREGRNPEIVEALRTAIIAQADALVVAAERDGYGRALDNYYWGSNGLVARVTMNLAVAQKLDPKPGYVGAMTQQVDHLLGRNPFARSYVTGVGYFPPQAPHHRPSIGDGVVPPWPGNLVGGPNGGPTAWVDDKGNYTTNEVAINWTTAMVYALAAVMP